MQTQRFSDRSSQSRFDAEQSLNARCSELVLMWVYFTQQQQTKKKRKGAKFLDHACVRCGCAIQVADGAIKAAKDAARVDAHMDDKRGRQACDRLREARAAEEAAAAAAAGGGGGGQRHAAAAIATTSARAAAATIARPSHRAQWTWEEDDELVGMVHILTKGQPTGTRAQAPFRSCTCAKALTETHPGVRNWLTATRICMQSK